MWTPALLFALACAPAHVSRPDGLVYDWHPPRAELPWVEVYPVQLGEVQVIADRVVIDAGKNLIIGPLTALVLVHPSEGALVVDPGPAAVEGFGISPQRAERMGLVLHAPLVDQLEGIGVAASDVRRVLLTGPRLEHASAIADFPQATVHIHQDDWRWARARRPWLGLATRALRGHSRFANVDMANGAPYGPFDHHVDVFGDGTVLLLPTPGASPGGMAVLINRPDRSLLWLGDLAWFDRHWRSPEPRAWPLRVTEDHDWKLAMDGLWRVRDWSQRSDALLVVAAHEPNNFEILDSFPAKAPPPPPPPLEALELRSGEVEIEAQ